MGGSQFHGGRCIRRAPLLILLSAGEGHGARAQVLPLSGLSRGPIYSAVASPRDTRAVQVEGGVAIRSRKVPSSAPHSGTARSTTPMCSQVQHHRLGGTQAGATRDIGSRSAPGRLEVDEPPTAEATFDSYMVVEVGSSATGRAARWATRPTHSSANGRARGSHRWGHVRRSCW